MDMIIYPDGISGEDALAIPSIGCQLLYFNEVKYAVFGRQRYRDLKRIIADIWPDYVGDIEIYDIFKRPRRAWQIILKFRAKI